MTTWNMTRCMCIGCIMPERLLIGRLILGDRCWRRVVVVPAPAVAS